MFLRVFHDSTIVTLFTGKCVKLVPRFCEPFIVLKCSDPSTYCLNLLVGIKVHHVFHFSNLKELWGSNDNLVSIKTLVTFEGLSSKPHKPKRVLN